MRAFYMGIIGFGIVGYAGTDALVAVAQDPQQSSSCDIKGNVSIATGERIYHVPGQEYYADTKISPQYGERWFCSEAEARAAGWRKARR
jgi:hypothetical protein